MPMGRSARWLVWGVYVVVWTTALLLPLHTLENTPVSKVPPGYRYLFAKSLHVAAYAVMALLSGNLRVMARLRWLLVFFLMGHATLTEIIQLYFIEGRSGTLQDVALDQVGVMIGLVLSWNWWTSKDP